MNIANILRRNAETMPDAVAIIEQNGRLSRRVTFAELERHTNELASVLSSQGLKKGDAVLVLHPMSIDLYEFLIALFKVGAVALFLDPTFGSAYIKRAFALCRPVASFIGGKARIFNLIEPQLRKIPLRFSPTMLALSRIAWGYTEGAEIAELDDDAPALITFTSGSTGLPKGIVRSHGFLQHQLAVLKETLALEPGQVDLTCLPIFLLANIAVGVTSVIADTRGLPPASTKGRWFLRQIRKHNVTSTVAPPAILEKICQASRERAVKLSSLEKIFTGGGPVFADLLQDATTAAPNASVNVLYGSTEAEPIACVSMSEMNNEDLQKMRRGKGLLTGIPHYNIQVRLLEMDPATGIGEIIVTGEHVIKGYLRGQGDKETKIAIDGEIWHRTGDAGYFDSHGRLWLVGRASAIICDSRGMLCPLQVESAARNLTGVRQAACVQYNDSRILLLETEHTMPRLDQLDWAQLDKVIAVRKLPMDRRHNSKLDYKDLQTLLQKVG